MSFRLEQIAGTSDSDTDSDNDGLSDWIEWATHGTSPTDADTDNDGVNDAVEVDEGSDPLDAASFFGLCVDVNLDVAVNVVDLTMIRRQLAPASLPGSFTPDRCNHYSGSSCVALDVTELRGFLANPAGAPLPDICPGVPHDVVTILFDMDGQASLWDPATNTAIFDDSTVVYEGSGSLDAFSDFAVVDVSIQAPLVPTPQNWTGNLFRFAMLMPSTAQISATDGVRVTLSSSSISPNTSNRVWFLGTNDIPQGIWKEHEIDPTVGFDLSSGTFNINQVRWIRFQWNLDETGPTGRTPFEEIYLDDLKRVLPRSP